MPHYFIAARDQYQVVMDPFFKHDRHFYIALFLWKSEAFDRFLNRCRKQNLRAVVGFKNELMQALAMVSGKITNDRQSHAIVYKLLQNVSCSAS